MTWKQNLQLLDIDIDARFEVRCQSNRCGYTRYVEVRKLLLNPWNRQYCLDEIERKMRCELRECRSKCTLMLASDADTEGFQGGLA